MPFNKTRWRIVYEDGTDKVETFHDDEGVAASAFLAGDIVVGWTRSLQVRYAGERRYRTIDTRCRCLPNGTRGRGPHGCPSSPEGNASPLRR